MVGMIGWSLRYQKESVGLANASDMFGMTSED